MKNILSFSILVILCLSIVCHNQYYISDAQYSEEGRVFTGNLNFQGNFDPDNYHIDWTYKGSDLLKPIEKFNIQISLECDKYPHIYVMDANQQRWENPFAISDSYKQKIKTCSKTKSLKDFGLTINEESTEPFSFSLTNPKTGELIFSTENADFIYTDIFISFAGLFTTNDVYGFGERYHELKLGDGKFTMWPNDTSGIRDDFGEGGGNAMGIHPIGKQPKKLLLDCYLITLMLKI